MRCSHLRQLNYTQLSFTGHGALLPGRACRACSTGLGDKLAAPGAEAGPAAADRLQTEGEGKVLVPLSNFARSTLTKSGGLLRATSDKQKTLSAQESGTRSYFLQW